MKKIKKVLSNVDRQSKSPEINSIILIDFLGKPLNHTSQLDLISKNWKFCKSQCDFSDYLDLLDDYWSSKSKAPISCLKSWTNFKNWVRPERTW